MPPFDRAATRHVREHHVAEPTDTKESVLLTKLVDELEVRHVPHDAVRDVPDPVLRVIGRFNALAHPTETVALIPDVGVSGDIGALCAALTP